MTRGISSLARSSGSPQWFLLCSWKTKETNSDLWLTLAFPRGEGEMFQNRPYICVGREEGKDRWVAFLFVTIRERLQSSCQCHLCVMDIAEKAGDEMGSLPPTLSSLPLSTSVQPPTATIPAAFTFTSSFKSLSSFKWAVTKTINTAWIQSKSSDSLHWRDVIWAIKFL